MTDIHCHILPQVDDGSDSLEDSLRMAALAEGSGVSSIIATPHCNLPHAELGNFRSEELWERFAELQYFIQQEGIRIEIHPGAEVFCTPETPSLLKSGKLVTLAESRFLLVEFFFNEDPRYIDDMLGRIMAEGAVPVVAHPERYECVQENPRLAEQWFKAGCGIQVNKGSVLGRLGRRSQSAAEWLLTRGIAHAVGSDAHSPHERTTDMGLIKKVLAEDFGRDYAQLLLEKNPQNIIRDKELIGY